jgi:hypothetical protein
MANLIQDLGGAIKTTIQNASARFSALDSPGGTLLVEYTDDEPTASIAGRSRCVISPLDHDPIPGTQYDESMQTVFRFELRFELHDRKNGASARSVIQQALYGTFGDRGAEMFGNFTDNGSNRLGGSGVVSIGPVVSDNEGIDNPVIVAELIVSMWHIVPMA